MRVAYPGQMVVNLSPFLRNRPLNLWPQAMLSIAPTDALVIRAQTVVEFSRNSDSTDGEPN
jgi:hypothetical protein